MTREERLFDAQKALLEEDGSRAEMLYRQILDEDPRNPGALGGMGVLACRRGEFIEGIELFQNALHWTPPDELQARSALFCHLGLAHRALGRKEDAIDMFRQSLELFPGQADANLNLGQIYFEREENGEAIACFQGLVETQAENASAWLTLGYILSLEGRFERAIQTLGEALRLDPSSPDACFYLAEALRKMERYEESLPHYQRMLQVGMEWPQAVLGYGKSLLALGNLGDGWDAMEFRLTGSFGTWERHRLPSWEGSVDEEKTVLAYAEEGVSAEIMFASCLPDLINTVDHCVVECDRSLHRLFQRSFPRATFVPLATENVGEIEPESPKAFRERNPWGLALDEQVALGSLPRFFRRSHDDFPIRKTYLVPDRDKVEQWSNRLAEIGGTAKIGILWQGSWTAESEKQTALPMRELRNLMLNHQSSAAWICLQNGSKQKDIDLYHRGAPIRIHLFKEAFEHDLDEMAALLTALDLVVTPPGYVAHLAGALGVRTWMILPGRADWRWNLGKQESLWHPTMRVYRRKDGQDWPRIFKNVDDDLKRFLTTIRPPEEETPATEIPATLAFPDRNRQTIRPSRKAG